MSNVSGRNIISIKPNGERKKNEIKIKSNLRKVVIYESERR